MRFDSARVSQSCQFGSLQLRSVRFCSDQFTSVQAFHFVRSISYRSAYLVQFRSDQSVQPSSVQIRLFSSKQSIQFNSVQVSPLSSVHDSLFSFRQFIQFSAGQSIHFRTGQISSAQFSSGQSVRFCPVRSDQVSSNLFN